jgi:hypothetical protein
MKYLDHCLSILYFVLGYFSYESFKKFPTGSGRGPGSGVFSTTAMWVFCLIGIKIFSWGVDILSISLDIDSLLSIILLYIQSTFLISQNQIF